MNSKIKLNLTFEIGFLHLFIFGFVKWGRVVSFRIFRTRNFETGVGRPVLLAYEMIDFVFRYEFWLYYLFGRDPEGRAISSNKLKISHSRGECRIFNTRFYPSRINVSSRQRGIYDLIFSNKHLFTYKGSNVCRTSQGYINRLKIFYPTERYT